MGDGETPEESPKQEQADEDPRRQSAEAEGPSPQEETQEVEGGPPDQSGGPTPHAGRFKPVAKPVRQRDSKQVMLIGFSGDHWLIDWLTEKLAMTKSEVIRQAIRFTHGTFVE